MKNKNLKFWIPFAGGFMIMPGQQTYLNGSYWKNNFINPFLLFGLFLLWHCAWVASPFLIMYYIA